MRRTVAVLAVCGAAGIAAAVSGPALGRSVPSLGITARQPLTVVGSSFRPREHLRVTVTLPGRVRSRSVTAGRTGHFEVVFLQLSASRCDLLRVVAIRQSGARVVLKRLPPPACLPV